MTRHELEVRESTLYTFDHTFRCGKKRTIRAGRHVTPAIQRSRPPLNYGRSVMSQELRVRFLDQTSGGEYPDSCHTRPNTHAQDMKGFALAVQDACSTSRSCLAAVCNDRPHASRWGAFFVRLGVLAFRKLTVWCHQKEVSPDGD